MLEAVKLCNDKSYVVCTDTTAYIYESVIVLSGEQCEFVRMSDM